MNRREVREYYRKSVGLFVLISSLFIIVASALAIYVSDFAEMSTKTNDDASNLALYGLYTAFMFGAIITIVYWILGIKHLKDDSEGTMRFQKLPSMISILIGVLCFGISISTYTKTNESWDEYTTVIFALLGLSGLVTIILNIIILIFMYKCLSFYDDRKLAKDVPEKMTMVGNNIKRIGYFAFMYSLIGVCIAFMSMYFSKQIVQFDEQFVDSNELFSTGYFVTYIVMIGLIICSVALGIALIVLNKKKVLVLASKILFIINCLSMLVFVILSVVSMSKKFVESSYPDISYIIFSLVLVIICLALAFSGIKLAKKSNQQI